MVRVVARVRARGRGRVRVRGRVKGRVGARARARARARPATDKRSAAPLTRFSMISGLLERMGPTWLGLGFGL